MGHYDNCRPGYCASCGQAKGYCEHTKKKKLKKLIKSDKKINNHKRKKIFESPKWKLLEK